jgi:hypothetical protein
MLTFVTAFEVLVGFLQAYIFTILACVYIGLSMAGHDEHEEHSDVVDLLTGPAERHAETVETTAEAVA